jgi:hypothetical protein
MRDGTTQKALREGRAMRRLAEARRLTAIELGRAAMGGEPRVFGDTLKEIGHTIGRDLVARGRASLVGDVYEVRTR